MKAEIRNNIINFFNSLNVGINAEPQQLTQAGSDRLYFRFKENDKSLIIAYNKNIRENDSFAYFTGMLRKSGINVPEIMGTSNNGTMYALQDLGDENLLDILNKNREGDNIPDFIINYYKTALTDLAKMQIKADSIIDYFKCFSINIFDKTAILFDLNYFKYYFLNLNKVIFDELKLQQDFEKFATELDDFGHKYFMFRDFQARNIMVLQNQVYYIDYQGARKGCLCYDAASILYQAKANLPEKLKEVLLDHYIIELQKYVSINPEKIRSITMDFVFLRVLQTLGAYGNRGLIERKSHFIESIPNAVKNMGKLLSVCQIEQKFPELFTACKQILKIKKYVNN